MRIILPVAITLISGILCIDCAYYWFMGLITAYFVIFLIAIMEY